MNETNTFNLVNEWETRNTDSTGGAEFTLDYDEAGNMIDDGERYLDDGERYLYVYDAFGRMVTVKNRVTPFATVAAYRYNGLGHRITQVGASGSATERFVYDDRWRMVAVYRNAETEPRERFIHHAAGLDGMGYSSYIDDLICRDQDVNLTGGGSTPDGTLEQRRYVVQNWRHDVVAVLNMGGRRRGVGPVSPIAPSFRSIGDMMPKFGTAFFGLRAELLAFAAEHFLKPEMFAYTEANRTPYFRRWELRGAPEPWGSEVSSVWVWDYEPAGEPSTDRDFAGKNENGLLLQIGDLDKHVLTESWLTAKCTDDAAFRRWKTINTKLKAITRVGGHLRSCVGGKLYESPRVRYTEGVHLAHLGGLELTQFSGNGHRFVLPQHSSKPW